MWLCDVVNNIICNNCIVEKASSTSNTFANHDQLIGSKESIEVKEKDEVFTATSDKTKLDGQAVDKTVPHLTVTSSPAVAPAAAPMLTSISNTMKSDGSPAVKRATPKTEPHPPTTSAAIPTTSTGMYHKI